MSTFMFVILLVLNFLHFSSGSRTHREYSMAHYYTITVGAPKLCGGLFSQRFTVVVVVRTTSALWPITLDVCDSCSTFGITAACLYSIGCSSSSTRGKCSLFVQSRRSDESSRHPYFLELGWQLDFTR